MSRGDHFDDDDDDRPRRRRDRDRDDDDRPSRHNRDRDESEDAYSDDPRPPRQSAKPGNGTGIGGLICGILGIVLAVGSGGCAFCCLLFVPFSWIGAAIAGVLGVVAIVLGLVSRSQGNPNSLPIWDIVLGGVGVAMSIVAIIVPIVFVANLPQPPAANNAQFQQPAARPNFNNNNNNNNARPKVNNNLK